ncbi:hypothetical protein [Enterobacter hormaechei]|uniref:hypothetical protein n=1 Tax=Enterobacter hormaechei TaxID=158836 RepID=UPI001D074A36|nr:hypothetical protein [Enterobacter hormaechei]
MENPTIAQMLMNPRFMAVLDKCLEEEELITQFERIHEVSRPAKRKHPIEALVDKATGYADSQWENFFDLFIPFVYEVVWLRWPERDNEGCWK